MAASRNSLIAVAVVLAGTAGVLVGRWLSERRIVEVTHAPAASWTPGDSFPSLLLTTEWGDSVLSDVLLARGGVVLFLDLECPPCSDMAKKWDRAARDGVVPAARVVAITSQSADAMARFRQDAGLEIALYRDPGPAFLLNGWVTSFPVEVVVGPNGVIASVGYDATAPVPDAVRRTAFGASD